MLFQYLLGKKKNPESSSDNYAQLCYWENGPGASAGIVGLLVVRNKQETYLQFHPKSMKGVADRGFTQLMSGTEGGFVSSLEDAMMIEGFRRSWKGDKKELLEMSDDDKLKIAKSGDYAESRLITLGKPTHQITLGNLDLDTMINTINQIKSEKPLWAPVGGTILHQHNTENCASIIAKVLHAGGARNIVRSENDQMGKMCALPAFLIAAAHELGVVEIALATVGGFIGGRFIGGAAEGYNASEAMGHLMQKEHKPYAVEATWGLKLLSSAVCGFIGTLTTNSPAEKFIVLPEMLLDFARKLETATFAAPVGCRIRSGI